MPELLNYRTLFVASGIVGGALLMLLALQTRKSYPGLVRMILGLNLLAAAVLDACFERYVPDAFLGLQVTAVVAFAWIDSGIRLFSGAPQRGRWPYLYVLLAMFALIYLFFAEPLRPRIVLTSLLLVPVFVDAALPLLKTPPKGRSFGFRFTATVFLLFVVAAVLRIVAVGSRLASDSPYFAVGVANTIYFLLILLLLLALAFGFIVLTHERLVSELNAAHEQFLAESEERARIERQLAQAERLGAVGRIAGGVAHFFNNQLCSIQLACSVLRRSLSTSGTSPPTLEIIEKACGRSAAITRRLVQYAQSQVLCTSQLNPVQLMDQIVPELRALAGERVSVTAFCSSTTPDVTLDADLLKETIVIFVRNAAEAMPLGGKLTITLCDVELDQFRGKQLGLEQGTFALLSVADTGSGMDDETLRHIFEPFFTTKGLATSQGLSLASAFGFIRQSGGTIAVSSAPGKGSRFEVYLPTAQAMPLKIAA